MKNEYKIICCNEDCGNVNTQNPKDITNILLLIGGSYKCPYCRGYKFYVTPQLKKERK